jgi:hypothetical protein
VCVCVCVYIYIYIYIFVLALVNPGLVTSTSIEIILQTVKIDLQGQFKKPSL